MDYAVYRIPAVPVRVKTRKIARSRVARRLRDSSSSVQDTFHTRQGLKKLEGLPGD